MKYWATLPLTEIIDELTSKIQAYDDHLKNSGIMSELRDSYNTFYGDSKIRDVGQQGELKSIRVNHYASLIRNLVSLVTNNKPAWQPIASNTDAASQASTTLAVGLLDFYMKDRRLDRTFRDACTMSCFLKEAWITTKWDVTKGKIIHAGDEENLPLHEGDLDYKLYSLNDIIRDHAKTDSSFDWIITRDFVSKWDLIAQFPEYTEAIQTISQKPYDDTRIKVKSNLDNVDCDTIPFYTFYFKPCAAIPNGRMITFVDGQGLTDNALPYPKIPIVRLSSENTFDSAFAHSPMMDVLPVQKGIDTLASILLTNNQAFGVQNIWTKKGGGLMVSQITGGMNLIESEEKPEPLQMTASSPETYRFLDVLVQQSQLLSGVNDAVRGQASAGQSGASLALLSQSALTYSNGLQQGYVSLIEDVGTLSIQILQQYANTQRVAILTGKHNRPLLKEWTSNDLSGISRITIESGNALSKTASGRLTMADSLLQSGMIKRPEQYLSVLTTGQLEPIYENEQSQLLLIRQENEKLSEGQTVRALLTDDHDNHILEHASVLSNPDVRNDPNSAVVQNTLAHIQEHMDLKQNMPPALAMLLKQQPMPPQSPAPSAPQAIPDVMNGQNSVTTDAGQVSGPRLPRDLLNGGEYKPNNN